MRVAFLGTRVSRAYIFPHFSETHHNFGGWLQVDRFGGMGLLSAVVPGRDARKGFGEARGESSLVMDASGLLPRSVSLWSTSSLRLEGSMVSSRERTLRTLCSF